ncbi:hypothetical protein [Mycolicibacterium arseniciresistens]|uniref:Uncharacterized protein n=1 Tax=Mycolicibacterium arseniciresistens TaxID=3062257 RepID=A0ABT8UE26_9MYCO|nr:hypothetical protein [Mycolicibacterium arseniciresistens]MDO3634454.1 hypothetical protein [Mycolicibacterium arseniciresistens]
MDETGLFDAPSGGTPSATGGKTVEQRMDEFAELAKAASQSAMKIRTGLNTLAGNAQSGSVSAASAQLARTKEAVSTLAASVEQLILVEESVSLRGSHGEESKFAGELQAALEKKGVAVTKGPEPYWLAYPAWFKIERTSKGSLEVILNGDKLDTTRPSAVADAVAEAVKEKFDAKQFSKLLIAVRDLLRRAGGANRSLNLDDVYDVLALQPGQRAARRKDFTKAAFYYSVHRLAEELEQTMNAPLRFPPANRPDMVFFSKEAESRKYLVVEFPTAGSS